MNTIEHSAVKRCREITSKILSVRTRHRPYETLRWSAQVLIYGPNERGDRLTRHLKPVEWYETYEEAQAAAVAISKAYDAPYEARS
jgi:hypothetical protein